MASLEFTNTTKDGEITGQNPDATSDYFLITDYNRDKNYWHEKICQAIKLMSASPTEDFQILYGGVVSDSGSTQIDVTAGAAIGKDSSGNFRLITIPALTNIDIPSGWNDNRQIWLVGEYDDVYSTETRTHVNGETYHYTLVDSYLGATTTDDLFTDASPAGNQVIWGSFKFNGSTFANQNVRSTLFNTNQHLGYNDVRLTFSSAVITVKGSTEVIGIKQNLNTTVTVTGAAGWRYVVCDSAGTITVETIPVAERTADTQVYTPTPVFNETYKGYYSTVNTTKRIIGIAWFSSTAVLEVIAYANGTKKNDDYWYTNAAGVSATTNGSRFQFTNAWVRSRGTNVTITDQGSGTTDSDGIKIEANGNGLLSFVIPLFFSVASNSAAQISINKNGATFKSSNIYHNNPAGFTSPSVVNYLIVSNAPVTQGDYFTIRLSISSGTVTDAFIYTGMEISFKEF